MRQSVINIRFFTVLVLVAIFSGSCSSPSILKVRYQLPASSTQLSGREVFLSLEDRRSDDALLSSSAQKRLKNFSGNFSLTVARPEGQKALVGAYELSAFLKEIFKRRLQNAGISVVEDRPQGIAQIVIVLEDFRLDLKGGKWLFRMAYRADLKKNGKVFAGETISGSAERLKLIGSSNSLHKPPRAIGMRIEEVLPLPGGYSL
jgi:uncharacterized lipoprotein YajG